MHGGLGTGTQMNTTVRFLLETINNLVHMAVSTTPSHTKRGGAAHVTGTHVRDDAPSNVCRAVQGVDLERAAGRPFPALVLHLNEVNISSPGHDRTSLNKARPNTTAPPSGEPCRGDAAHS